MSIDNYIVKPMDVLLDNFGEGNHKPGSGSAATLNALLSCQLLMTVIKLTLKDNRHRSYKRNQTELETIKNEIDNVIYPRLLVLFQSDSEVFDRVIKLREKKRKTSVENLYLVNNELVDAVKVAIEIPFEIARLAYKLSTYSIKIFDYGWKAVRGDSGVAMENALAALTGCQFIINLNLLSIPEDDDLSKHIFSKLKSLESTIDDLEDKVSSRRKSLVEEVNRVYAFNSYIKSKTLAKGASKNYSNRDIEELATDILNRMWTDKDKVWKVGAPKEPIDILMPTKILKALGFHYSQEKTLGVGVNNTEIAGIINRDKKVVLTSKQFRPEIQRFTLAHELGHALLHREAVLHRDIPIDGSEIRPRKELIEHQADKFAVYFLMPAKIVKRSFIKIFGKSKLSINDIHHLGILDYKVNLELIDYARAVASLSALNGLLFQSITELLKMSKEAMAIRLIELKLITR